MWRVLVKHIDVSQEHVVKEDLLSALYCEFINRVNEVGVDVNRAISHPHTQSLVQYVCGLGPRKGAHLLKAGICVLMTQPSFVMQTLTLGLL